MSNITAIIFSRNRAMQLDLLLQSMKKYAPTMFDKAIVIYRPDGIGPKFVKAYDLLQKEYENALVYFYEQESHDRESFADLTRRAVNLSTEYVSFFCDDDVFFREAPQPVISPLSVGYSWRLGKNTTFNYMESRWQNQLQGDFLYAFSCDGTVYSTSDVRDWLEGAKPFDNPNAFEIEMNLVLERRMPRARLSYAEHSCLVGIPHNSVTSWPKTNRHGGGSAAVLNDMYLEGCRIDLEAMNFSNVVGCHQEIPYKFKDLSDRSNTTGERAAAQHATSDASDAAPFKTAPHGVQGDPATGSARYPHETKARNNDLLGCKPKSNARSGVDTRESAPFVASNRPNRPIFSILHPTARLPQGWKPAYEQAKKNADHWEDVQYILCVDDADEAKLPAQSEMPADVFVEINFGRPCSVAGYNAAAPYALGQIFIHAQDDVFFPPHWDTELINAIQNSSHPIDWIGRPAGDCEFVIHVSSGSPRDPFQMAPQIYSRARYEKLGYAFYPEYLGMYADNEFTEHAYKDGVVIRAMHLLFEQRHPLLGHKDVEYDATYRHENSDESYRLGEAILERRRKEIGFSQRDIPGLASTIAQSSDAAGDTASSDERRRRILVCLPGQNFSQGYTAAWTALYRNLLFNHEVIGPVWGYTSNVYATRAGFIPAVQSVAEQLKTSDFYVLWIDDDNIVSFEQVQALIDDLDAHPELSGVGGWCFTQVDGARIGHRISCGNLNAEGRVEPFTVEDLSAQFHKGLASVDYSGLPCFLMRAHTLLEMGSGAWGPLLAPWVRYGAYGEDVGFFIRAAWGDGALDRAHEGLFPLQEATKEARSHLFAVDPRVKVEHIKGSDAQPQNFTWPPAAPEAILDAELIEDFEQENAAELVCAGAD